MSTTGSCPKCGTTLAHIHRRLAERLVFSDVFQCPNCGNHVYRLYPRLQADAWFLASRYTRCIRCGTFDIHRLATRDRIDSMSMKLTNWLFRLTFAPLNKCSACRLQYYDWRPVHPESRHRHLSPQRRTSPSFPQN